MACHNTPCLSTPCQTLHRSCPGRTLLSHLHTAAYTILTSPPLPPLYFPTLHPSSPPAARPRHTSHHAALPHSNAPPTPPPHRTASLGRYHAKLRTSASAFDLLQLDVDLMAYWLLLVMLARLSYEVHVCYMWLKNYKRGLTTLPATHHTTHPSPISSRAPRRHSTPHLSPHTQTTLPNPQPHHHTPTPTPAPPHPRPRLAQPKYNRRLLSVEMAKFVPRPVPATLLRMHNGSSHHPPLRHTLDIASHTAGASICFGHLGAGI